MNEYVSRIQPIASAVSISLPHICLAKSSAIVYPIKRYTSLLIISLPLDVTYSAFMFEASSHKFWKRAMER